MHSQWKTIPVLLLGALIGAGLFRALELPLAYILGAMAGAALVTNLLGPLTDVRYLRRGGQLLIGASIGGVLSPDVLAELTRLFPLMLGVAIAANIASAAIAVPIARIAGASPLTGILSCLPAGMAEMATLARELGESEQTVAIIHTIRVVLVLVSFHCCLG